MDMSSDARAMSVSKDSVPNSTDMKFILSAQRVYEELGSRKELAQLVDNPPKLLLEQECEVRLHSPTGKQRTCRIYVFDKYFIVASLRVKKKKTNAGTEGGTSIGFTDASSSDNQVVWFGDKKTASQSGDGSSESSSSNERQGSKVVEYDDDSDESDLEAELMDDFDRELSEDLRKHRQYNLKMWIDLRKVKARFQESAGQYGILITYVTKIQEEIAPGQFRFDTSVDMAEVWLQNVTVAKTVLGIIQEAVNKNAQEVLANNMFSKNSVYKNSGGNGRSSTVESVATGTTDTETDSMHSDSSASGRGKKNNSMSHRTLSSTSTGSNSKGGKKRRKFVRAKEALQATSAYIASSDLQFGEDGSADHAGVITMKDIAKRYKEFVPKVAEHDEGLEAEYSVKFKNPKLGFALSSIKKIGPFVCRLVEHGMAEASGVALGDRVVAINDVEIQKDMAWQECVKVIKAETRDDQPLTITFIRKQKNEIDRQNREKEKERAKELLEAGAGKEEEEGKTEAENSNGAVEAVDVPGTPEPVLGKKTVDMKTIELRRKTDDGSAYPKFTIKRKRTGKRRFAKKHDVLKNMKYQITNMKELAEFRKNKTKMFDLFGNIESLFDTVLGYLQTDKEKSCVFSLREIYQTEYKYNSELNTLREFHVKLLSSYKNVRCKDLKTGRPFCEHRRPLRFCKQLSSYRELAVERKEVDSIFLNLKPIMKSNVYLWKNLQTKLGGLYEKLEAGTHVQVNELLEVFSSCFAEIAPFLQIYWQYCQRYSSACEKLRHLRATNEHFVKIIEPIEKKNKMRLANLLCKPVQRITKYQLLFRDLNKYVKKYVNDEKAKGTYDNQKELFETVSTKLDSACTKLVDLAQKVNRKVGEAESLEQMIEVFGEIGGKDGGIDFLLQPHRRFDSRHQVCYQHVSGEEKEDEAVLYLFNDMFAVAVAKSKRSPSVFANGSKLSFPLRKLKNLSLGNRSTSITNKNTKKISLMSGSSPSEAASKRRSVRATNRTPKGAQSKATSSSETKKDEYYDVLCHYFFRNISRIGKRENKTEEEGEAYGVDCFCHTKAKGQTDMDTSQVVFWFDSEEQRNQLYDLLTELQSKDKEKRTQLEQLREKHGKKKKGRRFKKKLDRHKKISVEKSKANSSIYSRTNA